MGLGQWCFVGFSPYLNIGLFESLPLALKPPWEGITPGGCHGPGKLFRPEGNGKPQLSQTHLAWETLEANGSVSGAGV